MESMKHSTKSANPVEALAAQNEAIKKAVMEESMAREKEKHENAVKKAEEEAEELAEALRKIQATNKAMEDELTGKQMEVLAKMQFMREEHSRRNKELK